MPRKQRNTAKRVFDRLRDECGFTGGYTITKDYIRERGRRSQDAYSTASDRLFQQQPTSRSRSIRPVDGSGLRQVLHG